MPASASDRGRGLRLFVGATLCLLVVFAAVAWIYFTAPERQQEQPVSRISARPPVALAIGAGTRPASFVGTSSGLLVSEDQGGSWQQVLIQGGVKAIGLSPSTSTPLYLAGAHFWRGDGAGFQQVATDLPTDAVQALAVDGSAANRVYAVVTGRGLYRSDDAGAHWFLLGSNVPEDVTDLVLVGAERPIFFVGTSRRGIFASVDGHTWSNANGFVNAALPTEIIFSLASDPQSGDRYVSPSGQSSSGALYAGTDRGLFKSIDGGQGWSPLPFHHPVGALAVSQNGTRLMLAIDLDGNVYRSRDGGITWR